jgi:hypothetical protein
MAGGVEIWLESFDLGVTGIILTVYKRRDSLRIIEIAAVQKARSCAAPCVHVSWPLVKFQDIVLKKSMLSGPPHTAKRLLLVLQTFCSSSHASIYVIDPLEPRLGDPKEVSQTCSADT